MSTTKANHVALTPQFSIDLDAELHKITQRQHLNDVHFLVALVRHALRHQPQQIEVKSEKNQLIFSQQGTPLDPNEWQALVDLLQKDPNAKDNQQRSLDLLETVYGIALLTIFLRFKSTKFTSGTQQLRTQHGRLVDVATVDNTAGYHLTVERNKPQQEKEETELKFYCSGASTAIFFNGKKINRPLKLENHLLALDFKTKHGHGSICIPTQGELSRFYFFKGGIRVGVKAFTPHQGQVVEGFWNSADTQFESLYQQTIQTGQPLLESYTQHIYQAIPKHFANLPEHHKRRLKNILLGMEPLGWANNFGKIPLFDHSAASFALSLADLHQLMRNFDVIPYLGKARPKTPRFVPVLSGEDQFFLGHKLNQPLNPLVGHLEKAINAKQQAQAQPQGISSADLDPDWKGFLFALNQHRLPMRFRFTQESSRIRRRSNGYQEVWLCMGEAKVKQAFQAFCCDPHTAHQWRYRLLDHLNA